jgi:hypothetical protein
MGIARYLSKLGSVLSAEGIVPVSKSGATWDAYATGTNTNLGNNTGWRFVLATSPVSGQFMAFF